MTVVEGEFICKSTYLSRIYTVVEGEVEREEGYIPVTTDPEEEANSLTLLVQEGVRYSGLQKTLAKIPSAHQF